MEQPENPYRKKGGRKGGRRKRGAHRDASFLPKESDASDSDSVIAVKATPSRN